MKKFITFTLCGTIMISFIACGEVPKQDKKEILGESAVEISNPSRECGTIQEAENLVVFKANIPTSIPEGYVLDSIYTIENSCIEVNYLNGESEICFRQERGERDISGDYNTYTVINTINIGEIEVTTKGNNENVNVATWINGDYTFFIGINGNGIKNDIINNMINSAV